ncbi:MAG TPA: NUMOD1 domain-containing DNA-binding protein [Chitinophagaceae bacterium]|nr:NUMOD1 domain-containing DNA-binding protein [Chitinophagaceae bacterium]
MNSLHRQLFRQGKPIPVADTVTNRLPGERWKTVPGFEGLYELSDHGRLRSLSRWVYSENRPDAYRPGRIIQLKYSIYSKNTKNKSGLDIQMKLHKDGHRYMLSVARYVYYLFVAPFDLNDHRLIVRRKDGDKLNCHYRNLRLDTLSDVIKEGFAAKTRRSVFQDQAKTVHQYTLDGKFVKSYSSAVEAGKKLGIPSLYINDAARTKVRPAAKFYWRYGKPRSRIQVTAFKERLAHTLRVQKRKVEQLTLKGKLLRTFDSVMQAARSVNSLSGSNISFVCQGRLKSSKGYKWRYAK